MRVAVVTSWHPHRGNYLEGTFVADQVEAMRADGYEVEVFHVPAIRGLPRLINHLRFSLAVAWRFRRKRFDVIHAHVTMPAGAAAVVLGRELGIPVVLTEHSSPFSLQTRAPFRAACRDTLLRADAVVAVSDLLAREMRELANVDIDVIPNLVRDEFFQIEPVAGRPLWRYLFMGRLEPQKGIDLLIEAHEGATVGAWWSNAEVRAAGSVRSLEIGIPKIASALSRTALAIVGDGSLREWVEAAGYGVISAKPRSYRIARAEAVRWIEWAHVVVCPSRHESFGLVAAEALAAGRYVVVPDHHPMAGRPGTTVYGRTTDLHLAMNAAMLMSRDFERPTDLSSSAFLERLAATYDKAQREFCRKRPELRAMAEGGPA